VSFHSWTCEAKWETAENCDTSIEGTFLKTGKIGIWSKKTVLIPVINIKTLYKLTCNISWLLTMKFINLLAPEFYIEILAHPVCKM